MTSRLKIVCAAVLLCLSIPAMADMGSHDGYASDGSRGHHSLGWGSDHGRCGWRYNGGEGVTPEKMHEHIKAKLDAMSARLEIKASQQTAWEEYARSVEQLAEHHVNKPNDDADAATLSRYRADRATEFAQKLTKIADASAKLQKALSEDQQKVFTQMSRHSHHMRDHG